MKKNIVIICVGIVAILLLSGISPAVGSLDTKQLEQNNNIIVEVNKYLGGKSSTILTDVPQEQAEELEEILINLNLAIENNDENAIAIYEKILNEKGFFGKEYQKILSKNSIFEKIKSSKYSGIFNNLEKSNGDNLSNTLCFFNAIGKGVIIFPLALKFWEAIVEIVKNASSPLAGLILLLVFLPLLVLIILFTDLIPFRILMSEGVILMDSGTITSIGLNGFKRLKVETEEVHVNVSWFTGITFNIPFTNRSFMWVSGIAGKVYESDI